jgi:hypothetical protein
LVRIPKDGWKKANDKLGESVKDQEAYMDRESEIAEQAKWKKPESPASEAAPDLIPQAKESLGERERERKEKRRLEAGDGRRTRYKRLREDTSVGREKRTNGSQGTYRARGDRKKEEGDRKDTPS